MSTQGAPVFGIARLLDTDGEALYGRPVRAYISKDEEPDESHTSELDVSDPFTGIQAGLLHDLNQLTTLTDSQGYARIQIEPPDMSLFKLDQPTGLGQPIDSAYDLYGDVYPSVGVLDDDNQLWVELDSIMVTETIQQVPSTIGGFNRFQLSQAALPGKIEAVTLAGRALLEFSIGGSRLGFTFRKENLPVGFFIYDYLSASLFVSDDSVTQVAITYEVPPFTIRDDDELRPRRLVPNASLTVKGNTVDLWSDHIALYPDVKLYMHLDHLQTIRTAAIVVFQNPLSKLEESKRYAEG